MGSIRKSPNSAVTELKHTHKQKHTNLIIKNCISHNITCPENISLAAKYYSFCYTPQPFHVLFNMSSLSLALNQQFNILRNTLTCSLAES